MIKKSVLLGLSITILLTGCGKKNASTERYETTNKDEIFEIVSEIRSDEQEGHSEMLIFPENKENFQEAYLYEENYGPSTAHQIVVAKQFDIEGFEAEVRRLLQVTENGRHTYYTEDEFSLPAVVFVYNHNNSYEYALLDENKMRIAYVCSTFIDNLDFIKKEYRPLHYEDLNEKDAFSYSIYSMPYKTF